MNFKLNYECLGLPATGKSWVVKNILTMDTENCILVSNWGVLHRFLFFLVGFILNIKVVIHYIELYFQNNNLGFLFFFRKLLIILTRLGALNVNNNVIIDEGALQALWGTVFRLEYSKTNKHLIKNLIGLVLKKQNVYYVKSKLLQHQMRVNERSRKHPFSSLNGEKLKLARIWFAYIIFESKKVTNVTLIINK